MKWDRVKHKAAIGQSYRNGGDWILVSTTYKPELFWGHEPIVEFPMERDFEALLLKVPPKD